jgi:20S proteasome alpha/beta subunit
MSGFVLNVSFDASTASAPAGFFGAIDDIVRYYETLITTPITVTIDVGYGEIDGAPLDSGALGESETNVVSASYGAVKTALSSVDPTAASHLPANLPSGGSIWLASAQGRALGLSSVSGIDGYAGFAADAPFTYSPTSRAVPGGYDFMGAVAHEFSEILGRFDGFGLSFEGTSAYTLFDMYHYTAPGVHTYTGLTTNYFSVDGGATNLDNFNTNPAGDLGDWASSAGADSYLAFSPMDQGNIVSQADIMALNAIGYSVAPTVVISNDFSTTLVSIGESYFIDQGGAATGPLLEIANSPVIAGEFVGWLPIGAVQTASGFDVAWKDPGAALYSVWTTDASGNFTGELVASVTGTNPTLEALELTFNQDLNGDSSIGPVTVTIEVDGATTLLEGGNEYFLKVGTNEMVLQYGGAPVLAGQFAGWNPIGAIQTASGFDLAWNEGGTGGLYSVWTTDASGHFNGELVGGVPGSDFTLEALESIFNQDLNGDGTIGSVESTIRVNGATSLLESGGDYLLEVTGDAQVLQYGGMPVTAGEFAGWSPIGAIRTGSGFDVAWNEGGTGGEYSVWTTDGLGRFNGELVAGVPGTNATLEALERLFNQDLNGDNTIGLVATTIQVNGPTGLVESGGNYLIESGATVAVLQYGGMPVTAGEFTGWNPIGAIWTGSGFDVAWNEGGTAGEYSIWTTNSGGQFNGELAAGVLGTNFTLESLEMTFGQDLNGDGMIGVPLIIIQVNGSTSLVQVGNDYNLEAGLNAEVLQYGGAVVTPGEFTGWNPIGAIQTASGFDVAWKDAGTGMFSVWTTDSMGHFNGEIVVNVPGTNPTLIALESAFGQDLNGNGITGTAGGITAGVSDAETIGVPPQTQEHVTPA